MNGSRLLRGRNLDRSENFFNHIVDDANMREIVHLQAGQCGNQIGSKVRGRGAEKRPRFVACATTARRSRERLSQSDIAWRRVEYE